MINLHVLSSGFTTPNGCAFLYPIYKFSSYLKKNGIKIKIFKTVSRSILDCDIICVDSKFYKRFWLSSKKTVFDDLERFSKRRLFFFDTTDSSSWIQTEVLPYVDYYCKSQIFKDLNLYKKPLYGNRIYSDYFNKKFNIKDNDESISIPIPEKYLNKIKVSWNSGLADYSLFGPLRMYLMNYIKPSFLMNKLKTESVLRKRTNNFHCKMGINYSKDSIACQRKLIKKILNIEAKKLNRIQYYNDLKNSKIVISPFGWGEITLKDFETFLTGGILMKPKMNHLKTWPNFFTNDTYVNFNWDASNLTKKIESIISDYKNFVKIGINGQKNYLKFIDNINSPKLFYKHLNSIINLP